MDLLSTQTFVISLKHRTDRRLEFKNMAEKIGLKFEFFDAIDGKKCEFTNQCKIELGNLGCSLSHMNLLSSIKNLSEDYFLILEDDAQFSEDLKNINDITLPDDWDFLYLGGNHNGHPIEFVSDKIHRLRKTYTTHAYFIKRKIIDSVIEKISNNFLVKPIDVIYSELQSEMKFYGYHPPFAWQAKGWSDILDREVNYDFLKHEKKN